MKTARTWAALLCMAVSSGPAAARAAVSPHAENAAAAVTTICAPFVLQRSGPVNDKLMSFGPKAPVRIKFTQSEKTGNRNCAVETDGSAEAVAAMLSAVRALPSLVWTDSPESEARLTLYCGKLGDRTFLAQFSRSDAGTVLFVLNELTPLGASRVCSAK